EHYQNRFQILLWDYRGHGKSDRRSTKILDDLSIRQHTQDMETIYQNLFPDRPEVILLGHSMGCQVSLEFQRRNPDITQAMVLILGAAGRSLDTFANSKLSPYIFRIVHRLIKATGPQTNRLTRPLLLSPLAWPFTKKMSLVDPLYTSRSDFLPYLEHISSMDILIFLEAAWQCQMHNAWDTLSNIDIPTLIVAAENDPFFPLNTMKRLNQEITASEFLLLAGGSHAAIVEQPETINYRLDRFLSEKLGADWPHPQNAESK
ncbi:MAG: alpha/beta hydrolase, partial [Myxococcota bacterium]|nr:alpha/beta hydrolase [Myxococcota bacterium]